MCWGRLNAYCMHIVKKKKEKKERTEKVIIKQNIDH